MERLESTINTLKDKGIEHKVYKHGIVIHADCLDIVELLDFDHVLTDPPYNINKAEWDSWKCQDEYCKFIFDIFDKCDKKLKSSGNLIWFHNDVLQISNIIQELKILENTYFNSFNIWDKRSYFQNGSWSNRTTDSTLRGLFNVCEYFIVYNAEKDNKFVEDMHSNPKHFRPLKDYFIAEKEKIKSANNWNTTQFNSYINEVTGTSSVISRHLFYDNQWEFPTKERYEKLQSTGYFPREYEELRAEYEELRAEYEELRAEYESTRPIFNVPNMASNILDVYNPNNSKEHPTMKPIELFVKLCSMYSNESDIILDPFLGSGTTAIACRNTNRLFIGIEKDKEYYELSCRRLDNAYDGYLF